MKLKITLALFLGTFATTFAQVEEEVVETVEVVEEEAVEVVEAAAVETVEDLRDFDYSIFEPTAQDTVVKYRRKIFPFIAGGYGNVSNDGAFANSQFGYLRSTFFEWGLAVRRPFNEDKNLLGLRYGISFSYNSLTPTQNNILVDNGNGETVLVDANLPDLKRNRTYFRNSYVNIPIALDFDFSTKSYNHANRKFVTNPGLNFGFGGYVGYNINSKQFIRYEEDGYKMTVKQHGKWNVNDFNYGLMAYFGYSSVKLYAKYDMQPVFKDNATDQKYWSLGLLLDFK